MQTRGLHPAPRQQKAQDMLLQEVKTKPAAKVQPAHSNNAGQRRAADWLLERIQKGRKEPFTEIVTLTPDIAECLLANNPDNRSIKQHLVDAFAADIDGDRWDLNGETIIVANDGVLNDGQHRCVAVVQSGKSIRTAIMFGVSRDSRYTVDGGSARTSGDYLKMEGAAHTNIAAAVAKYLNLHRRGYSSWSGNSVVVTKAMIRQEYWNCEREIQVAIQAIDGKFMRKFGLSPIAAAYVLIARRNPAECSVFFQRLNDGVGLNRGDAILGLRSRILETYAAKSAPYSASQKVETIIRYWNAWRKGTTVHTLRLTNEIPKIEA